MSSIDNPVVLRSVRVAGIAAIPIFTGSIPTVDQPTNRANGFKLWVVKASSLAKTTAAAPSLAPCKKW